MIRTKPNNIDDALFDALNLLLETQSEDLSADAPDDSEDTLTVFDSSASTEESGYEASESSDSSEVVDDTATGDDVGISDEGAESEVAPAVPLSAADFADLDVNLVAEHALALKAVLDDAGVGLDTEDPMYADYAADYQAALAYLASIDISTADATTEVTTEAAEEEIAPAAPMTGADFAGVELSVVVEHALGLKAVLDEAGAGLNTQDPMYADYAVEYQAAVAYLASADIIL